jgi:TonB family protein
LHDESAAAPLYVDGRPTLEVVPDLWADWRRAMARVASVLLHVLVLGLLFIHWPETKHEVEAPEIPVEIVMEPPPKPKVEPPPKPVPPTVQGESGGNPDLAAGQPSEAPIPQPSKAPPAKAQEAPKPLSSDQAAQSPTPKQAPPPPATPKPAEAPKAPQVPQPAKAKPSPPAQQPVQAAEAPKVPAPPPAEAPLPPLPEAAPWPTPVPKPPPPVEKAPPRVAKAAPPPVAMSSSVPAKTPAPPPAAPVDKAPPQVASLPPSRGPAPSHPESTLRGMGGGDPYLNAMRDDIVSNIIYPRAANGSAGMARYVLTVDRRGFLLELRLVKSSGSTALDRAGMDAIQNTAPFRPLPRRILGSSIRIEAQLYIAPAPGSSGKP